MPRVRLRKISLLVSSASYSSIDASKVSRNASDRSAASGWQVVLHAAGAEVVEHHAAAGDRLEEVEDLLAVA